MAAEWWSRSGWEGLHHVQGGDGRSYSRPKVRGGWRKELPQAQAHGWWPRGATPRPRSGAAAALCWNSFEEIPHIQGKSYPSKTVGTERGHQRADRLKPQSQTTSQSEYSDHSLCNWMKLSHAMWGHQKRTGHGGQVRQYVVHWRKEWQSTSIFLPWESHE